MMALTVKLISISSRIDGDDGGDVGDQDSGVPIVPLLEDCDSE